MSDFIEDVGIAILLFIGILAIIVAIIGLVLAIKEDIENKTFYQYECVTLDNEIITCDRVDTTEGGIIGTRDDTSYLIKQYKKVKKENKWNVKIIFI